MLIVSIVGGVVIMAWMAYEKNTQINNMRKLLKEKPKELLWSRDYMPCSECGAAYLRSYLQKVQGPFESYYCEKHKKPYDRIDCGMGSSLGSINPTRYYKIDVEVTNKGKLIKK